MQANRKKLAVLVVVVGIALVFTGAVASADDGPGKQTLAGVWQAALTILSACGPTGVPVAGFPVLLTFTRDGDVIETPASLELADIASIRTSPGLGRWQYEGWQQFSAVFRFFVISVPANLPNGSATVTEAIELDKDGDSLASTGTADFLDANGNSIVKHCFTETATRLK